MKSDKKNLEILLSFYSITSLKVSESKRGIVGKRRLS